ncbi:GNAT family N-acetyltransferase [Tabrizicola sp.]|uniref:GNAT family N-acetyltransferase n=1 Tax=Tabrizicola sp. TaxID=2005166 RepID=UPI0026319747|nr:GNAT family N-acetyltransferase [Tabrizicola sp.]MDM7932465.1 GNAT family N-acetyltransferase [Tabrizicola sp.]
MGVTIFAGLHTHLRPKAARIYWEAFGGKLGRVLGPEPRALAFLERVIRADLCLSAVDESGALVGMAGFKTPSGSFAGGNWSDLIAIYGPVGGRWRGWLLRALSQDSDNDRFLIDGICVDRKHRGKGIGTHLLAALYDEAAARGYRSIRLDVVDANWRARALYEREGFLATQTQTIGLLRHLFGFAAATTMVRPLRSPGP